MKTMQELVALLGQSLESPKCRSILGRFRALKREVLDLAPDECMPKDFYLSSIAEGISVKYEESGKVTTIFLMGKGKDGYSQFVGELGSGLSFSSTPEAVRTFFGPPSFERPASKEGEPFPHGAVMRFDHPGHSVHIQFWRAAPGIELVTLMSPSSVPGRRA